MTNRVENLLKFVNKNKEGLEIGPYINPIAPRSKGYNVKILDVFSTDELKDRASKDPLLSEFEARRIEEVDFVKSASEIGTLSDIDENFDYILSSHNLEHVPNPILFLQGCSKILKPEGHLTLALPDFRCCWDRFRPLTCVADWLEAFFEKRTKPSAKQIFMQNSMHCRWYNEKEVFPTMPLNTPVSELKSLGTLEAAYRNFASYFYEEEDMPYIDTHCWTLIPSSFKLLISDLRFLKLIDLKIKEISQTLHSEFIVHLQKKEIENSEIDCFYECRIQLMREIASFYPDQFSESVEL